MVLIKDTPKKEELQVYQPEKQSKVVLSSNNANLMISANRKPTTVRDTSKDYSDSSKPSLRHPEAFKQQHTSPYNQMASGVDIENSPEDVYSTNSEKGHSR